MTIKKLAALATAAALALCMLAGCFGGSRAMTSVLLDMLAGQYENVSFETDPELEDILRRAVRENDNEEDILAALEKALGGDTDFAGLAYGQQGEGAFDLIFYPGDDPEAAARSAYAGWAGVLGRLPGDGRYSAGLAMIETENGYYILIQNTVTQPAREPQDEDDEPEKPKGPYTDHGNGSYTINTKEGLQKLYDDLRNAGKLGEYNQYLTADITLESDVELTVNRDDNEGWFIKDFGITYTGKVGGVVGENSAGSTVENCKATGVTVTDNGGLGTEVGGVVGYNSGTVYDDCKSDYEPAIGGGNTTPAPLSGEDGQQNVTVIS